MTYPNGIIAEFEYDALYRAYSCDQRRFLQADPLGIDGGVNLYAYGNLNPLAFIDPWGLREYPAVNISGGFSAGPFSFEGGSITVVDVMTGETQDRFGVKPKDRKK